MSKKCFEREREGGLWCRGTRGEEREVTCARGVGLSKNASREIEVCGLQRRVEKRER